jgi:hypothetical protein
MTSESNKCKYGVMRYPKRRSVGLSPLVSVRSIFHVRENDFADVLTRSQLMHFYH